MADGDLVLAPVGRGDARGVLLLRVDAATGEPAGAIAFVAPRGDPTRDARLFAEAARLFARAAMAVGVNAAAARPLLDALVHRLREAILVDDARGTHLRRRGVVLNHLTAEGFRGQDDSTRAFVARRGDPTRDARVFADQAGRFARAAIGDGVNAPGARHLLRGVDGSGAPWVPRRGVVLDQLLYGAAGGAINLLPVPEAQRARRRLREAILVDDAGRAMRVLLVDAAGAGDLFPAPEAHGARHHLLDAILVDDARAAHLRRRGVVLNDLTAEGFSGQDDSTRVPVGAGLPTASRGGAILFLTTVADVFDHDPAAQGGTAVFVLVADADGLGRGCPTARLLDGRSVPLLASEPPGADGYSSSVHPDAVEQQNAELLRSISILFKKVTELEKKRNTVHIRKRRSREQMTERRNPYGEKLLKLRGILGDFVLFALPQVLMFYPAAANTDSNEKSKDITVEEQVVVALIVFFISIWISAMLLSTFGKGRKLTAVVSALTLISVLSITAFIDFSISKTLPETEIYTVLFVMHFFIMTCIIVHLWHKFVKLPRPEDITSPIKALWHTIIRPIRRCAIPQTCDKDSLTAPLLPRTTSDIKDSLSTVRQLV
ncbi:hypothetical protein ACP4OV_002420 [Aristida adscensionis]